MHMHAHVWEPKNNETQIKNKHFTRETRTSLDARKTRSRLNHLYTTATHHLCTHGIQVWFEQRWQSNRIKTYCPIIAF
jgi:hypothetical protein